MGFHGGKVKKLLMCRMNRVEWGMSEVRVDGGDGEEREEAIVDMMGFQ